TTSTATPAGTLSGGNQQKVVVAREMSRDVKLMIVSQPTRGLDVGSIEFVHRRLVAQRDEGVAVLIVSSELDEIYALADRIAVMYEGQIVAFCPPTIPEEELGLLMAGSQVDGATAPAAEGEAAGSAVPGAADEPEKPVPAQEPSSHE
ncbi:MAG TPA: heme ABC transporter ATP-binding protein, partial [Streptosporangiaceae bacterium]|nr:heme ABC transporter ATP-binding protein [Streptosporangiaceae bacterium]